jgi:hypothetical protein
MKVDGQPDDEILARHLADAGSDLGGKAATVLQRAAPAVIAAVVEGRPELVDQRVVGGKQLNPLKACVPRPAGSGHEALDGFLDLGFRHLVRAI